MSEKKIGRYRIIRELGRGGMATVYQAYDPVLERTVALKLLPNYFAHDPEFAARFEREAKTVAALEHPGIVPMYDYGTEGGWPYLVMRLMKGGSLKDLIDREPLSLEEAEHIIGRIAKALDKAHSLGIVHRDLKPGNILFNEDEAFLSDFGIVKLAEGSSNYTKTGNALGTPAYMSPEQGDGRVEIDHRADVYALGIILYEMLSGTAPYVHDSTPWLLVMHLTHPIPNILEVRSDLPPSIQSVIEKAMAKQREDRYQSAGALAADLRVVARDGITAVSPPSSQTVLSRPNPVPTTTVPVQQTPAPQPMTTAVPTRTAPANQPVIKKEAEEKLATAVSAPKNAFKTFFQRWWRVGAMLLAAILYFSADAAYRQFAFSWSSSPATFFRNLWGVIAFLFAGIAIEHLIHKRWFRSIVFFAFMGLWFRSGIYPYSRLPQELIRFSDPLDLITVYGSLVPFLWAIVDAVRQPGETTQSSRQLGKELRSNWFVFLILGILSFGIGLGLMWVASMMNLEFWWRSQFAQSTTFIGGMVGAYALGLRMTKTWRKKRIS